MQAVVDALVAASIDLVTCTHALKVRFSSVDPSWTLVSLHKQPVVTHVRRGLAMVDHAPAASFDFVDDKFRARVHACLRKARCFLRAR